MSDERTCGARFAFLNEHPFKRTAIDLSISL